MSVWFSESVNCLFFLYTRAPSFRLVQRHKGALALSRGFACLAFAISEIAFELARGPKPPVQRATFDTQQRIMAGSALAKGQASRLRADTIRVSHFMIKNVNNPCDGRSHHQRHCFFHLITAVTFRRSHQKKTRMFVGLSALCRPPSFSLEKKNKPMRIVPSRVESRSHNQQRSRGPHGDSAKCAR